MLAGTTYLECRGARMRIGEVHARSTAPLLVSLLITLQARSPCSYAEATIFSLNLFPCPAPGFNLPTYCCGPNATECCDSNSGVNIPVGRIFLRESQVNTSGPDTTSTNAGSSPTTSSATVTSDSSNPSSIRSTLASLTSSSTQAPDASGNKSLSIGLGIGIPLGSITISVLAFLAWELRRHNNMKEAVMQVNVVGDEKIIVTSKPETKRRTQLAEVDGQNETELDFRNQVYELPQRRL